jgi:ribosomal protein S19
MARSKWKGFYIAPDLLLLNNKHLNVTQRNSAVPNNLLSKFLYIHTGNEFKKIFISTDKIGLKIGGLAFTRKLKNKNVSKLKKK